MHSSWNADYIHLCQRRAEKARNQLIPEAMARLGLSEESVQIGVLNTLLAARAMTAYHGTSKESEESIKQHGFRVDRKKIGATQLHQFDDPEAIKYNYFSKLKLFSGFFSHSENPRLVRVILPEELRVEEDEYTVYEEAGIHGAIGVKTSESIEPHLVIPSDQTTITPEQFYKISDTFEIELTQEISGAENHLIDSVLLDSIKMDKECLQKSGELSKQKEMPVRQIFSTI
jgi:hypothetical protein